MHTYDDTKEKKNLKKIHIKNLLENTVNNSILMERAKKSDKLKTSLENLSKFITSRRTTSFTVSLRLLLEVPEEQSPVFNIFLTNKTISLKADVDFKIKKAPFQLTVSTEDESVLIMDIPNDLFIEWMNALKIVFRMHPMR